VEAISGFLVQVGPTVMLPVGLFLVALLFGIKPIRAFVSALKAGIGILGLNIMLGFVGSSLGPVAQGIVARTGLSLPIPDLGVGTMIMIAWAPVYAALTIPAGVLLNVILLALRVTKTIEIDIWQYCTWTYSAAVVYAVTGSPIGAVLAFVATGVISFVLGDRQAPAIQEHFNLEGCSFPHSFSAPFALLAGPANRLFDAIPWFKDLKADPESIQRRFGPAGDPTVIGAVVGVILALIAGYTGAQTLQFAVSMAGIMLLMPHMITVLTSGLFPIRDAARDWLTKRFPGRQYYIGLDCAVGVAQAPTIACALLLIPITVVLAAILPGNRLLPMADLAFLGFWVASALPFFGNNIIRGTIYGTAMIALSLWMATNGAPIVTSLAIEAGVSVPAGVEYVSYLTIYPLGWLSGWIASLL